MWRKLHYVTPATSSYQMFHNMGIDGKINKFYEKVLSTIYSHGGSSFKIFLGNLQIFNAKLRQINNDIIQEITNKLFQIFCELYTLRSKELIKPLYQTNQIRGS